MKKILDYELILGFASSDINQTQPIKNTTNTSVKAILDIIQEEHQRENNLEIVYKVKGLKDWIKTIVPKNPKNYSGSSITLPSGTTKAILKTIIANTPTQNIWVALQNRCEYVPKITINGKKYLPHNVNGAYIQYQICYSPTKTKDPKCQIQITANFNSNSNINTIVGFWLG
jgi:hypothetical protein